MSRASERAPTSPHPPSLEAFEAVSDAVEAGAGLPEVARATARALDVSLAIVDASAGVVASACASPEDERAVLSGKEGAIHIELRVADAVVGDLRYRPRGEPPIPAVVRMIATLISLEVERSRAPERASEAAVASFVGDLLGRTVTDRENLLARANELGSDLSAGGSVVVVRAHPHHAVEGDWRARALTLVERGARGVVGGALAANARGEEWGAASGEIVVVVPGTDRERVGRTANAVRRELEVGLSGFGIAVTHSRPASDPVDLHRAGTEARLAANVAEAEGKDSLAFDETGAYRLLLPAMSEDPAELQRFHEETVAPLVAYDEQYDTELLKTLESFLDADGNVARTAERLYTHRHTIRYRLERVRELTGLDVASSDGRERLSLGLKAMRVLGIPSPQGPVTEPGASAGRVAREGRIARATDREGDRHRRRPTAGATTSLATEGELPLEPRGPG